MAASKDPVPAPILDPRAAALAASEPVPAGQPIAGLPTVDHSKLTNLPSLKHEPANEDYSGIYEKRDNGEPFALAVWDESPLGRTHWLKNNLHTMNITEEEFRQQFDEPKKSKKDDEKK